MKQPSWLFWVVGVFALLYNGYGVVDYALTISNNEAYLAMYTEEQMAYWQDLPAWRLVVWTTGIVAAALGTVT